MYHYPLHSAPAPPPQPSHLSSSSGNEVNVSVDMTRTNEDSLGPDTAVASVDQSESNGKSLSPNLRGCGQHMVISPTTTMHVPAGLSTVKPNLWIT